MSAATFDTYAFISKLKESGVPEAQAVAHAEALKQAVADEAATKHDLRELELRLEARISSAETSILKWVIGLLLGQTAIIAALVRLL